MSSDSPNEAVIRTPDQRLRVFVSSTKNELTAERRAVSRAISALRLTPVLFELGASPYPPQEVYRAYLEQSDIFIGVYWQSYGWVGPGMAISGLEEEFNLSAGMPQLLYVKTPAVDREPKLNDLLTRVRQGGAVSYRRFTTPTELSRLVRDDLATLLSERFAGTREPAPTTEVPATAASRLLGPLPVDTTSLIGREGDICDVAEQLGREGVRLLTLTGPGGVGKTRLAVAVGERLRARYDENVAFVPLAAVTEPGMVLDAIARSSGADLGGAGAPLEILAEVFGDDRMLLILDNLEQVVGAAADMGELLSRCSGVEILATSRTALGLAAEHEYPVQPLAVPVDHGDDLLGDLEASPATALFVDRARAVRPGFTLDADSAVAIAGICRRLEGVPLAIELAAARTRLLDPATLLNRLTASLDALGTGAVDLPERQRTLRATVQWSVGLLESDERSLLETVAVFADGWTISAAAQVAGLEEDRALELSEALARHSLVQLATGGRHPRCSMLETVRAFVAERIEARPDFAEIQRRHARYYRTLVEQADRPLRGGAGQGGWLDVLDAEARNLATAVTWHLTNDPGALPRIFRALWPFWHLRDRQVEARPWVEELEHAATSFEAKDRAELVWTMLVTADEVGDDSAELSARRQLAPLLETIEDPLLRALCWLGMGWSSPLSEDFDGALREVTLSLEHLRGHDEPFWTALAEYTAAGLEIAAGDPDAALRHVRDMHDLADHFDTDWLLARYRMLMGALAIAQGRLDEAQELLGEALDLSLEIRAVRYVTLCVAEFAQLASARGAPELAALLAGAAEGLRGRAGMSTWPLHRRGEAKLVAQVRDALGSEQFDRVFAAGSKLSQREAIAELRAWAGDGTP